MRRILLPAVLTLLAIALACANAQAATIVRLSADRIAFYYDRFLVEADGNVRIETSDGFQASGQAFSMDLKLNRYLLAGHVSMSVHGGTPVHGAAIADFLDFNRIYFVPITSEPDRWTFLNGDLAHPVKGRVMPGDVFYFPELPPHPSLTATSAVIGAKTYVRFSGAQTYLAGLGAPLGSFVVNFSSNPYFAQNTLSGANFDTTWNFAGSENALSAVHLREDTQNGIYLAFEQHLVGDHEYAIFSVNPLTKFNRFYNLQLYERLGSRFQIQTFTQLFTAQDIGLPPLASTQSTYINATQAFSKAYLQISGNLTNYNMLGPGVYECCKVNGVPQPIAGSLSHPSSLQATLTQFQTRVAKLPFYEQLYVGYGFNHDSVGSMYNVPIPVPGLQSFGAPCPPAQQTIKDNTLFCPTYTTIYNTVYGINLFTPSIKLGGNGSNPYGAYYINASFNKQRQYNSLPHYIDNTNTNVSLSRSFSRSFNAYVNYSVQNTGDYYKVGGYVPCSPVVTPSPSAVAANGPNVLGAPNAFAAAKPTPTPSPTPSPKPSTNPYCPPSLTAFRGVATLRTASLGLNYVPVPEFNVSMLLRNHHDFPNAVPNVFALPATNVIGQPLYNNYLGQPPWDLTADVRFKFLPHLQADVARTYYFHYGTLNWSPSFIVQITPL